MVSEIWLKSIRTLKILPKRLPKSMKNQGCVFGVFLERPLGANWRGTTLSFWDPKIPKQSQKEPKGHQKWAKGRPKSIKKSIFGKSREKGCQRLHPLLFTTDPFGNHFPSKIEKIVSKKACKIRCRKVLKINSKRLPKWYKNGCQNRWKWILFWKRLKCSKLFVLQ